MGELNSVRRGTLTIRVWTRRGAFNKMIKFSTFTHQLFVLALEVILAGLRGIIPVVPGHGPRFLAL